MAKKWKPDSQMTREDYKEQAESLENFIISSVVVIGIILLIVFAGMTA